MAAFESFGRAVESQIGGFAESVSGSLSGTIGPVVGTCLAIYFTAKAWRVMMGQSRGTVGELVLDTARCGFVAWFALEAGHYAALAIPAVSGLESMLTSALPNAPANAWAAIDLLWASAADGIASLWGLVGSFGVTQIGGEILLSVSVIAMTLLGVLLTSASLGVILLAKISLALTLGLGPLFLCALMFPAARGWFDPWLRSALTWTLAIVMAGAVLVFFSGLFTDRIARITAAASGAAGADVFGAWLELAVTLVITLTASSIMRMIPSIAAGLAGGCSMQAAGLASLMAGAAAPARAITGGLLTGYGAATGSKEIAKAGRQILGHRGMEAQGTLPAAAIGAAAGGAAMLSSAAMRRIHRATDGTAGGAAANVSSLSGGTAASASSLSGGSDPAGN